MAAVPGAGRARRRLDHSGGAEVKGIEHLGEILGVRDTCQGGFGGLAWTRRVVFGVLADERKGGRKKAGQKYLVGGWIRLWWKDAGEVSVEPKKENARPGLGEMQGGEGDEGQRTWEENQKVAS
ncbi:uncharacterized protein N7511_000723 [Penicillium nucicola]|uniref:uncharacterized protein n=1 Tax=Penicillium nucicola TaxID=1850975 RepID=UPI0025452FC8|nr:uncharacterized protein N7511_000723 [Penicillium nucicola]KAJ5775712.1 hypothetical protein N7511_000723 [Penicillium nucicola]